MNLFEVVKDDLFSVLASPNRQLYAAALEVLYEAFQDNLKISETVFYTMLRSKLENELVEADLKDEGIDEDEMKDISGRARFLIRKLCSKGWFQKERGQNFSEYLIVPDYSIRLLELFHSLTNEKPMRGYSYVFNTFSALKIADEKGIYEKMTSVYSAYENTQDLIKILKTVYHNVNRYFQMQIDMQDINEVLAFHFDDFGQKVMELYIKPLKIKDSVPKYRVPIQSILSSWLEDDDILYDMAKAAFQDGRKKGENECKAELLKMMMFVKDKYNCLENDYLDEIDRQVSRYTRATTQKLENLTNHDQSVRGNLNYLLSLLVDKKNSGNLLDSLQNIWGIYEQTWISGKSLWYSKRPVKREITAPVYIEENKPSEEALLDAAKILQNLYGKAEVENYMNSLLTDKESCSTEDMKVNDDYSYIMSLLAVLNSTDRNSFYRVESTAAYFSSGVYRIPKVRFIRKEKRK